VLAGAGPGDGDQTALGIFVAFLVLHPLAVRIATRLDPLRSLVAGWCAFAVYQGLLLVFIRRGVTSG